MNLKRTLPVLALGALAIAAGIGIVAYRSVNAQDATPEASTAALPGFAPFGHGRGPAGGYDGESLAEALGIGVDELKTAYQEAQQAGLDQAVEAGLITQAQADELIARGAAFPFGGRWMDWLSQNGIDFEALLADALGISGEELQAAYTQAAYARIDQAVANGNLTAEQADLMKGRHALFSDEGFRTSMRSAFESAVEQAVSAGVITQPQANAILESSVGEGFPGFGGFGKHGRPGGFGGGRGW